MSKFIIQGRKPIAGSIEVSGAKNSALKLLAATLLLDGTSEVTRVPQIEDIHRLIEIMKDLGVGVTNDGGTYWITPEGIHKSVMNPQLHQKLRASIMLAGPLLHRMGEVDFPIPGGCVLGKRPIDFFLDGYKAFGVEIEDRADGYKLVARNLHAAKIVFPRISVTGTEAMMMFAAKIPGTTTIVNAAMEPEIPHLAALLNRSGANIRGAGTPVITIEGVQKLHAAVLDTLPDRIEAGTFAILGAATEGHVKVTGIVPDHLEIVWKLFTQAGVKFVLDKDSVEILPGNSLRAIPKDLVTHEYPGFPTDIQAPMTVLMTQAHGSSLIFETIYEGRLFYIDALNAMGANILMCDPHRVLVTGPTKLTGKKIASPDIRAGIALVIAGLIADGVTEIDNIYQIDRGYEDIENRLRSLGADITRTE